MPDTHLMAFRRERDVLNKTLMDYSNRDIKRFLNLDTSTYADNVLMAKEKELLGLAVSLALRCEDCIQYHTLQCFEAGVTTPELVEAMQVPLIVGGTIVIPHLRRLLRNWDELLEQPLGRAITESLVMEIRDHSDRLMGQTDTLRSRLSQLCVYLWRSVSEFNWVGCFLAGDDPNSLIIDVYQGKPVESKKYPLNRGLFSEITTGQKILLVGEEIDKPGSPFEGFGFSRGLLAPITGKGQCHGVLVIGLSEDQEISPMAIELVTRIGEMIAMHI